MTPRVLLLATAAATLCAAPVAHVAHADDTFETRATSAQPLATPASLADLVWALTATCDQGDDVEQRQCRHVRDTRAGELTGHLMIVDADPEAFTVGPWNPAKKSVPVSLVACVRCGGIKVEGKRWILVGNKPATIGADGIAHGEALYDNARAFSTAAAAKTWSDAIAHVRVQLLVQPGTKPAWHVGATAGVALDVVGYLVTNPCDGTVLLSSPRQDKVAPDRSACAAGQTPVSVPK